jgi:hypothetical protein
MWTDHHLLGGDGQNTTAKSKPDPSGSGKGQAENLRIRAADPRERARKKSPKLKPGEPHDRHQGATNLEGTRWSKPSQPRVTARAERVRKVASPDRRRQRAGRQGSSRIPSDGSSSEQRGRWEWTPHADVDGGANFDNPKRGVHLPQDSLKAGLRVSRKGVERGGLNSASWNVSSKEMRRS